MNQQSNSAQVFLTVTTFADQNDGSNFDGLSLRDAVLMAQSDPGKEYIITLPEGTHSLTIQGNEDLRFQEESNPTLGLFDQIVTRSGDIDIQTTVKIIGASANTTIIDASGLGDRLFDVRGGGFLTLENVTVQNGRTTGTFEEGRVDPKDPESFLGGGIRVNTGGGAEINRSIVKNNKILWDGFTDVANVNGGGIANRGLMEINDTTIIGNDSDVNAGGIFNSGTMEILNSTIANNSANITVFYVDQIEGGGGIKNAEGGTLLVRNSTISGNSTFSSGNEEETLLEGAGGGGILSSSGETVIINSTIVNNTAPVGAGILSSRIESDAAIIPITLQNSIVAQNNISPDTASGFGGDLEGFFNTNTSSFNLIAIGNGILIDGNEGNIVGSASNPINPLIEPLAYNGGLTPTHALGDGSPAINKGNNSTILQRTLNTEPLLTDQRGLPRIEQDIVDIGSYEKSGISQTATDVLLSSSSSRLNSPVYRFQNLNQPGTYLYTGLQERENIRANFPQFQEEGLAFRVGVAPGDNLMAMYRFQNSNVPGTYIYVNEQERQNIRRNFTNFIEEGIAFYVYEANANIGEDIYRFQSLDNPGTYLYVTEEERRNILENFTNFVQEGVAFEVSF